MPFVTISGNVRDHAGIIIPANREAELYFVPVEPQIVSGSPAALAGVEVKADFTPTTGDFTVDLFSDLTPKFRYWMELRWLVNPADTAPERRAYGHARWPDPIYPDTGGSIGNLIDPLQTFPYVYVDSSAPNAGVRNQLHFNTNTDDLYERVVTW